MAQTPYIKKEAILYHYILCLSYKSYRVVVFEMPLSLLSFFQDLNEFLKFLR